MSFREGKAPVEPHSRQARQEPRPPIIVIWLAILSRGEPREDASAYKPVASAWKARPDRRQRGPITSLQVAMFGGCQPPWYPRRSAEQASRFHVTKRTMHCDILVFLISILTFPTKVPSDSLGWIGSLKRTSDKSLFPMALGSCGHRITHQLRPINMNGRSILAVTSILP